MSAFGGKADIQPIPCDICFWHKADIYCACFDYFLIAKLTSYDGLPLGQAKGFYAFVIRKLEVNCATHCCCLFCNTHFHRSGCPGTNPLTQFGGI